MLKVPYKKAVICCLFVKSVAVFASSEGIYVVPESDGLNHAVEVELKRVRIQLDGDGQMKLDYQLPNELAGTDAPRFVLHGKSTNGQIWFLKGEEASATCQKAEGADVSCFMEYAKVQNPETGEMVFDIDIDFDIDIESAKQYVNSLEGLSQERVEELHLAIMALAEEAIGIVKAQVNTDNSTY